MRPTFTDKLEAGRFHSGHYASSPGDPFGAFKLMGPCGAELIIIASDGEGLTERWEHVSVSTRHRPPNWQEMCFVKNLFWRDDELVIQFHPPKNEYINCHPHCLHLWLPPYPVRLPPTLLVGPRDQSFTGNFFKTSREDPA
jgi:hypothetical protein